MKVKKIFKYGTGEIIPEGAVYLNTIAQTEIKMHPDRPDLGGYAKCWLVWHYFLVEVEDSNDR